jgi:phosphorylase kinase alpha/beta subunit
MLIIQNESILDFIKHKYTLPDIKELSSFLRSRGTISFSALKNGLFPAAKTEAQNTYTGYTSIWVRDNIHVAHAHYVFGEKNIAKKTIVTLMAYFKKYRHRFDGIISGKVDAQNPMNRPHIRFNGDNLDEIDQKWAHAQNDALGYFLWFYCKLAIERLIKPEADDINILLLFPSYWQTIRYWEDEDSGHWEETRKIAASSIGVVVAALTTLKDFLSDHYTLENSHEILESLNGLIQKGREELNKILPFECIQPNPSQYRRYDSALLFLIYPLGVVSDNATDKIINNVIGNLQGDYGIKRYLGDSYWAADYKKNLTPEARTIDFSDELSARDSLLKKGEEAQWCIFDPIISTIFGIKFQKTARQEYLEQQTYYLNRSLGQITGKESKLGEFLCPESYYIENSRYVPNDPTPLLWTQANLAIALTTMEQSLKS